MGQEAHTLPEMVALIQRTLHYPSDWKGNQVLATANENYGIVPAASATAVSKANAIIAMMRDMGDL